MKLISFLIYLILALVHSKLQYPSIRYDVNRLNLNRPSYPVRTLLIDNYDSYTYNLYQLLASINGYEPIVILNNKYSSWDEIISTYGIGSSSGSSISSSLIDNIVLSPGPGHPSNTIDFGISSEVIRNAQIPILGVCLGHQGIACTFGGKVIHSAEPTHGRISKVQHRGSDIFETIPNHFEVVRYHSLEVDRHHIPNDLMVTAWTEDGTVMGLKHKTKHIYGVQFHPESICSTFGYQIIENFNKITNNPINRELKQNFIFYDIKPVKPIEVRSNHEVYEVKDSSIDVKKIYSQRNIHIIQQKFDSKMMKIDQLFSYLYNRSDASFWLDSSSHEAEDVMLKSDGHNNQEWNRRFSFMGSLESTYDYSIEYIGNNQIIERNIWDDSNSNNISDYNHDNISLHTNIIHQNIFEYLKNRLSDEKNISTTYSYTIASSNTITNSSEFNLFPFNLSEMLFGYIGYEARNAATHILSSEFNYSSTHSNDFYENRWIHRDGDGDYNSSISHPIALFMCPTQYIVIDHDSDYMYIISKADNRNSRSNLFMSHSSMNSFHELESYTKRMGEKLLDRINRFQSNFNSLESHTKNNDNNIDNSNNNNSNNSNNVKKILIADKSRKEYKESIKQSMDKIRSGDTYEVCLTMQFHGKADIQSSLDTYMRLRTKNAAPYSTYMRYNPMRRYFNRYVHDSNTKNKIVSEFIEYSCEMKEKFGLGWSKSNGFAVLCSSPERYLKADKDGSIETKPIKGTSKRNLFDPEADKVIAKKLEFDIKSRSENLMIVDLMRNDLGRVCEIGSVIASKLMKIETYASVHQLVSTIHGKLKSTTSIIDALVATFPGGSMTGAPKMRTMEIIDQLEQRPRGIYSGALGYISLNGVTDLNIVIRTAYMVDNQIIVGSGGAIVILSDPEQEVEEVLVKSQAVSQALGYTVDFPADV